MTDHRFGGFILAAIVVNSLIMALEDYKDPGKLNGSPNFRNQFVSNIREVHLLPSYSLPHHKGKCRP